MKIPEVFGCPWCEKSVRVGPRFCPGCGNVIRTRRARLAVEPTVQPFDRLVPVDPDELPELHVVDDTFEEASVENPEEWPGRES